MVPRYSRKKIILGTVLVFGIVIFCLFICIRFYLSTNDHVYSATGDALDLAVLDGIVSVDKNDSEIGKTDGVVRAVVVPHHLAATKSIALGIKALVPSNPRLIILISPDHYFKCPKILCTTKGMFSSFFGTTTISDINVSDLEKNSDLVADSDLFKNEHGIYTIVPFIKHYIPEAQIIPIAISQKNRGSKQSRSEILKLLKPLLLQKDVALVISSDFSHYLPLAESNQMDAKTQKSFCSGNSDEILKLQNPNQSDCPMCLWVLEQEAKDLGFWNPSLISHTNSANLMHDISAKETTSHFTFVLSTLPISGSCQ